MMSRDELLASAQQLGIDRALSYTRASLIDEIVRADSTEQPDKRARGLLGRARDLVARMVEKGLHLPESAGRLPLPEVPAGIRKGLPPLATVALAEVYAAQSHYEQALRVLDDVLQREPGHAYALRLRRTVSLAMQQLQSPPPEPDNDVAPPASLPEPVIAPPRVAGRVQSLVPHENCLRIERAKQSGARVTWTVRPTSFARGRASWPHGRLVVRVVTVLPSWQGPSTQTKDVEVDALAGKLEVVAEPSSVVCAAIGWRHDNELMVMASDRLTTNV